MVRKPLNANVVFSCFTTPSSSGATDPAPDPTQEANNGQFDILWSWRWNVESPDCFFNRRHERGGGTDSNHSKFPILVNRHRKDTERSCYGITSACLIAKTF